MKFTNMKLTGLLAGIVLTFGSFGAYAEESHMAEALKHAEAAAKADDAKIYRRTCGEQRRPMRKPPMNTWMPASRA